MFWGHQVGEDEQEVCRGVVVYIKGIKAPIPVGRLSQGGSGRKFRVVHHWGLLKGCQ